MSTSTPERSRAKRSRSSPTGKTPKQVEKRPLSLRSLLSKPKVTSSPKKKLTYDSSRTSRLYSPPPSWTDEEDNQLTQFVLLNTSGEVWPTMKRTKYWEGARDFLSTTCGSSRRTSGACRSRVTKHLSQRFKSPVDAEQYFSRQEDEDLLNVSLPALSIDERIQDNVEDSVGDDESIVTRSASYDGIDIDVVDSLSKILEQLFMMDSDKQLQILKELFSKYMSNLEISVPEDFIELCARGMKNLTCAGRSNILYALAKGFGTQRLSGDDTLFPMKQVTCGLVEYCANFFTAVTIDKVSCPQDYRLWMETMYSLFGNKWLNLHCGPMWRVQDTEQGQPLARSSLHLYTEEASVNIPGISARTIQRGIAASPFSTGANIQVEILDDAVKAHPDATWWIKSDGTDIVPGLTESVRREWSGDVDMGDGAVQKQHEDYLKRVEIASRISRSLHDCEQRQETLKDLMAIKESVADDLTFIPQALKNANDQYSEKLASGKAVGDKELYSLSWTIDELGRLNSEGRELFTEMTALIHLLDSERPSLIQSNAPRRVANLSERLLVFIRGVTRHQRHKATHVLVTMISPSDRSKKPYALPICCMPYSSMTEKSARSHVNDVVLEMTKRKMKIAGFVSNGEYNVFRMKGFTRPTSVLKLRTLARNKYSHMSVKKMKAMLHPIATTQGCVAEVPNPCVSTELLTEIHSWETAGASSEDILNRLRLRCVPCGYTYHPWTPKRPEETNEDKLRSILAQLEFSHNVHEYDRNGIPFRTHLYVPEIHPISRAEHHEREDDAHVLKRIATSTRAGGPTELRLERFTEALQDPDSGLTYPALTGQRKQSVCDAERLFSREMVNFMEKHGYSFEAKYISIILNWRRASDERGLTELERSKFNYQMLNYLLDDLMPWHASNYDFSTIEVNRSLTGIRGMTREVLVALTTTIESREWMRRDIVNKGVHIEHPRASSTDDLECFFSVLRSMAGNHFTCKSVMLEWRKTCIEFLK